MPRPPRAVLPGAPLHLIQRGNNRSACFVDDVDRTHFQVALRETGELAGCAIHAYVMMTNHVHLLVTARDATSPSRMMQALGRRYVRFFNDRHGRSGTLWEGRFRSTMVDSERYFLTCSRYIETNPVRAGLVFAPETYRWSSFRSNALGEADPIVTRHRLFTALGTSPEQRRSAYRALFDEALDASVIEAIRHASHAGTVLGSTQTREALERALRRSLTRSTHGGARRSPRASG